MKGIVCFLFAIYSVVAQTPSYTKATNEKAESIEKIKAVVEEINHLKLRKTRYELTPYYLDTYSDEQGKIRKAIMYGGYPESNLLTIEYFNEEGNICHLIFENGDAEERGNHCSENTYMYHHCGNTYFANGKMIFLESKYWCGDGILVSTNTIMLEESKYFNDGYHINTQRIMKLLAEREKDTSVNLEIMKSEKLYYFSEDNLQINDYVVINTNDVIVREGPDFKSDKKEKYDTGMYVKIIDTGNPETIEKYGTHKWYKIEDSGYRVGWIFGAFIEPVYLEFE